MSMNQNAAVKARKPGISRTDWRTPISQPVTAAASLAKLLNSACQLAKPNQLMNVMVIRNAVGEAKKRNGVGGGGLIGDPGSAAGLDAQRSGLTYVMALLRALSNLWGRKGGMTASRG